MNLLYRVPPPVNIFRYFTFIYIRTQYFFISHHSAVSICKTFLCFTEYFFSRKHSFLPPSTPFRKMLHNLQLNYTPPRYFFVNPNFLLASKKSFKAHYFKHKREDIAAFPRHFYLIFNSFAKMISSQIFSL